jgi:hypothetical protein
LGELPAPQHPAPHRAGPRGKAVES